MVEQRTENPCVPGSIPGDTTLKIRELQKCDSLFLYMDLGLKWLEKVMMQKVVGNYRLFCAGFVDIFSEKEIPLDKVLVMF